MKYMNKEENLQNALDNLYIAACYNQNKSDFNKLAIAFVSPVVLGRRTCMYEKVD